MQDVFKARLALENFKKHAYQCELGSAELMLVLEYTMPWSIQCFAYIVLADVIKWHSGENGSNHRNLVL